MRVLRGSLFPCSCAFALLSTIAVLCPAVCAQTAAVAIVSPVCEYSASPLGIETQSPRLSWQLTSAGRGEKQTAYQVLVASTPERLGQNRGDLWDSGRVNSDTSIQVPYHGAALASDTRYYWKVRVWDAEGNVTPYTPPQFWQMGLLDASDWKGYWIGLPQHWAGRGLLFHTSFRVSQPVVRATAYVAGVGYSEFHLNGHKVGDHVLDPAVSDYNKHVYYSTYDITNGIEQGLNGVGVATGNGWYGSPTLRFQINLHFADGTEDTIFSGSKEARVGRWWVAAGPEIDNSIYDGETYDARLEKTGWDLAVAKPEDPIERTEGWFHGDLVPFPPGRLTSQQMEPIKIVKTLTPVAITNPKPGVYVFDTGQNMAGWAQLHVHGPAGTRVMLKFAEYLAPDGTVDQTNLHTARAMDTYILKGSRDEIWQPKFTYHGFRFVQVEGFPGTPDKDALRFKVVHSALADGGSIETSSDLINRIQKMVYWTESNNLTGIPTDCPQRDERFGWMNDLTARLEESLYNFNGALFYTKFAKDVQDTQVPSGAIADTAPFKGGSIPADPVSESYLLMGWFLYQNYGDLNVLRDHYDSYKAWVKYLASRSPHDLTEYGYYGDWGAPKAFVMKAEVPMGFSAASLDTPKLFMSSGYFLYANHLMQQIAKTLGHAEDERYYAARVEQIRAAFNAKYFNNSTGGYAANNEAADSFGLFLHAQQGNAESKLAANLNAVATAQNFHVATGNLGTKYLLEMLVEHGYPESAYKIATQTTYPSWGYMLDNDATTLWERWELLKGNGMNSHDHPMEGSVSSYLYKYLAGIRPDPEAPGYKNTIIRPYLAEGLDWVKAKRNTMYGPVSVEWRKSRDGLHMHVEVPVNATATVFVPSASKAVLVDGKAAGSAPGVRLLRREKDASLFKVQSGTYNFATAQR